MEKKEVAVESPVVVSGLTLVPVVEVSVNCAHTGKVTSFSGVKQPVAVVVVLPSSKVAFRISGEEVSIEQLTQEAPALEEALEGLQSG